MIREIEIEQLHEAEYNPRIDLQEGDPEFESLKRNLAKYGMVTPIVWNERTGNIVGGHQRLKAWTALGKKTAPVSVINVDDEDEKVLNLALNKISGEWDYGKLTEILSGYEMTDAVLSGFTGDELALLLAGNDDDIESDFSEWDDDYETDSGAYIIRLLFDSREDAQEWISLQNLPGKVKPHSQTTLIPMEPAKWHG